MLTVLARRWNKADRAGWFYSGLGIASILSLAGTAIAWYFFLLRWVTGNRIAAFAGAAFCGFAPGFGYLLHAPPKTRLSGIGLGPYASLGEAIRRIGTYTKAECVVVEE